MHYNDILLHTWLNDPLSKPIRSGLIYCGLDQRFNALVFISSQEVSCLGRPKVRTQVLKVEIKAYSGSAEAPQ